MLSLLRSACLCLFLPAFLLPAAARAEPKLDLALVLAVDVSSSMDPHEQQLQRDGFVEAFRSPVIHQAIRKGIIGRIAVTYVEWSSADDQTVIVPWTVIDGPDAAVTFAQRLSYLPARRGTTTSISGALEFSAKLLDQVEGEPVRRVIDVSGDGPNNDGHSVTDARALVLTKGITINGLPVMIKDPEAAWDMEGLDVYYRDCVIGGIGAFMQPIRAVDQFAALVEMKILREVSGIDGKAAPHAVPAASEIAVDCQTGEKKRKESDRPGKGLQP